MAGAPRLVVLVGVVVRRLVDMVPVVVADLHREEVDPAAVGVHLVGDTRITGDRGMAVVGTMVDTMAMEDGVGGWGSVSIGRGTATTVIIRTITITRITTHRTTLTATTMRPPILRGFHTILLRLPRAKVLPTHNQKQTVHYLRHRFTEAMQDIQSRLRPDPLRRRRHRLRVNRWGLPT